MPCGTSVKYGTPVHCVSCQPGKTYSGKYDKAQCMACTICSTGKHWSRTAPWSRTLGAAQSARKDFILFRLVLLVGLARIVALKVKMNFQKSAAEII